MTAIDHLAGLWAVSLCTWGIFCLYISIRIERFIVKRYEQETDLLKTIYFTEHATFSRHIPNFFSSALYTSHLMSVIWMWDYCRKKKPYRDISEANEVICHFSNQEIRRVKWYAISVIILVIHGIAYYTFKFIWPEVFD